MKETPPTKFQLFAALRIAEYPTLYRCSDDVICNCILSGRGAPKWENGVVVCEDRVFNNETWKYEKPPLRMSIETALTLIDSEKIPAISWDIGRGPIDSIPNDAEESFLGALDMFLFSWGKMTSDEWRTAAKAYSIVHNYGENNSVVDRKFNDYLNFAGKIKEWQAKVDAVRYFQRHGVIDPATFIGEGI